MDGLKENFESEGGEKTRRGAHVARNDGTLRQRKGEKHTGVGGCGA